MKLLNFGSCNIDFVYSLNHIVKPGETETAVRREIFPGGKGLNQSIAIAKAGAKIYHAGIVGNDGKILKEVMQKSGVDISYLKEVPEQNGHAVIQVSETGENSIFIFPGSNEMISNDYIDSVFDDFGKGDILLIQNEINNVDRIIEKAYVKQMDIIFNPSPINQKIKSIDFNKLSYIILNEVEAEEITGRKLPEDVLNFFALEYPSLKVVLTLGSKGSILQDGNKRIHQSAFSVDAVDTTAAGDTFTGYFIAGIANGSDRKYTLKLASAASALAVSKPGASSSVPSADEVIKALPDLKELNTNFKSDSIRNKIYSYIEENLKTANLDELSGILGYSPVYTGSLVKKLTDCSFSDIILGKRCEAAADKLLSTDIPIDEIINDIGYENKSFFRRLFKEKYGKTPLEYRKTKQ